MVASGQLMRSRLDAPRASRRNCSMYPSTCITRCFRFEVFSKRVIVGYVLIVETRGVKFRIVRAIDSSTMVGRAKSQWRRPVLSRETEEKNGKKDRGTFFETVFVLLAFAYTAR